MTANDVQEPATAYSNDEDGSTDETPLLVSQENGQDEDEVNPGELTFDEDVAGGLGRHLGIVSCTMLIVGRIIGVGIFSMPGLILGSVGSVGASLAIWVVGFILSFCGLFVYLELGTTFPRSGAEKVYLEAMYPRPKYLTTVIFAAHAILLGFTASGCIIFASNILIALGIQPQLWVVRGIALGVIIFVTLVHGLTPRFGVHLMNALSFFKLFLVSFIVVTGFVVMGGGTRVKDPMANFRDLFAGSSPNSNDYATAMFKVLNAYAGWGNVNNVLNEVRDPIRTLKISGPLGLGICATLFLLANIAYFAAASKEEILDSGITVASLFFQKVFGEHAQRALTVFVALSALGNVLTITFAAARVNQELAKEGVPLPFGNKFWASNWPTGKSPMPALIIHLIPSVLVIVFPPPKVVYPFILNVEGYPAQIIHFFIIVGLFYLRYTKPHIRRPFKVGWPFAVFYFIAACFLMVAPFLPPANGVGDTPPLPYWLYCVVGIAVLFSGVLYWAGWRIILPRVFGYELIPRKETLSDGTVVTLFSQRRVEKK